MNCCARHIGSARSCFGWMSRMYERRYRRKGLDKNQRGLLDALVAYDVEGARLLEVGCGVGELHQTLLQRGAAEAFGVDLAPRMLEVAETRARERGLHDQTEYRLGDFVEIIEEVPVADVTVLDKVVCCYPAPVALLGAALSRTRRIVALSYPKRNRFTIVWNALWNLGFWLLRSDFRGFVHSSSLVENTLRDAGLTKVYEHNSALWHNQVFVLAR